MEDDYDGGLDDDDDNDTNSCGNYMPIHPLI